MTSSLKTHLIAYTAGAVFVLLLLAFFTSQVTKASAPTGLPATIATTSALTVTTTPILAIATSSCSARIISTTASPIMIGFTDAQGFVPSGVQGFLQAASTTVAYDSGQYGCGAVRIYSYVSGSITVSDSR